MESDSLLIEGSPGTNLHKTVGKGRKKKGALAKLAEKKRLNSDGGSEYGSTVSLQRNIETEPKESSSKEEPVKHTDKIESASNNNRDRNLETKKDKSESQEDKNETIDQSKNRESEDRPNIPKPQPRKLNLQKDKSSKQKEEELLATLEGGTVVSIYDKVEKTPTGRKKKELYSRQRNKLKDKADTDDEQLAKRKLFPAENKLDNSLSLLGPVKAKPGLSPINDLPPLDGDNNSNKLKNVELAPPVPMDIDHDLEASKETNNSDVIHNNAPSDATVHRFRALRMTPDRCKSEESLKNINFVPKPPSTPRSGRSNSKGEKRNREANSSGEEADTEVKKQLSDINASSENSPNVSNNAKVTKMDTDENYGKTDSSNLDSTKPPQKKGLSVHPDAIANSGLDKSLTADISSGVNNVKIEGNSVFSTENKSESPIVVKDVEESPSNGLNSQDKNDKKKEKKKSKIKLKKSRIEPEPMEATEDVSPSKASIDSIGSASDLKAITESYQQVLKADSSPSKKYSEVYPGSVGKLTPVKDTAMIPEPSPGAGKLSPIQPKTLPPPLPHDMKSASLRTTYKTDPSYTMNKFFGRSMSGVTEREKLHADTMSQRSFSTTTALHPLSTREARDR